MEIKVAAVAAEVRESMERELERNVKEHIKRQVLIKLAAQTQLNTSYLIDAEIEQMKQ
jgi:FKBP-type peptidyl-prolyl cis-trans isomerase (trigger factor)